MIAIAYRVSRCVIHPATSTHAVHTSVSLRLTGEVPITTAIDFLRIEAKVLARADGLDRSDGPPGVRLFAAHQGCFALAGGRLSGAVRRELEEMLCARCPRPDATSEPDGVQACFERLSAFGQVEVKSGPSYLVPRGTRFATEASLLRSDAPPAWLRAANPGNWAVDEWSALIDGDFGPWTMAEVEGRVVSICHTPAAIPDMAAECGTWTDPGYRGRGYAAATTAAWSWLAARVTPSLFYSTSAQNTSSQCVAARLGLPRLGWSWALIARNAGADDPSRA